MGFGKSAIRGISPILIGLAVSAFTLFGGSNIEVQITRAERDADTCSIYGNIINGTDNHLNAFALQNNLLASDMAANAQSEEEQQVLSYSLQPNEKCTLIVAAVVSGVQSRYTPFISKCDMKDVREGDCQRSVKFTLAPTMDWKTIGTADWQAQKQFEAQKKQAEKDLILKAQQEKAANAAAAKKKIEDAAAAAKQKQDAIAAAAEQQQEQAAQQSEASAEAQYTVQFENGTDSDTIYTKLSQMLANRAADFNVDPSQYDSLVRFVAKEIEYCSSLSRDDVRDAMNRGVGNFRYYRDGKYRDCNIRGPMMPAPLDGRGLRLSVQMPINPDNLPIPGQPLSADFVFQVMFLPKTGDRQIKSFWEAQSFASYGIMQAVIPLR